MFTEYGQGFFFNYTQLEIGSNVQNNSVANLSCVLIQCVAWSDYFVVLGFIIVIFVGFNCELLWSLWNGKVTFKQWNIQIDNFNRKLSWHKTELRFLWYFFLKDWSGVQYCLLFLSVFGFPQTALFEVNTWCSVWFYRSIKDGAEFQISGQMSR